MLKKFENSFANGSTVEINPVLSKEFCNWSRDLLARDQLQKQQKKANFWSTDPTKNIKKNTKNLTPHIFIID